MTLDTFFLQERQDLCLKLHRSSGCGEEGEEGREKEDVSHGRIVASSTEIRNQNHVFERYEFTAHRLPDTGQPSAVFSTTLAFGQ